MAGKPAFLFMLKGIKRVIDYKGYYIKDLPSEILVKEYNIKDFHIDPIYHGKIPIGSYDREKGLDFGLYPDSTDSWEVDKLIKNFVPTESLMVYVFKELLEPIWVSNQDKPERDIFFDDAFLTTYNRHLIDE